MMWGKEDTFRVLQWTLIVIGLVLVGFWAGTRLHGAIGKSSDLRKFEAARDGLQKRAHPVSHPTPSRALTTDHPVDTSLWAEGRVAEYRESLDHHFDAPLAILRVPRIDLEVAVLEGTSELALNRGVGHITGTSLPGDGGNVGIAGHRDGYFRGLKDIVEGDVIEMETLVGSEIYTITELFLVDPPDVWVLDPTESPTITLVTCYPFYFVGSAPQRYIVRAEKSES